MGWWSLKDNLNPHECLQLTNSTDTEKFFTIIDFIDYWADHDYKLGEVDFEHIYNQIREGYVAGQINDWDKS